MYADDAAISVSVSNNEELQRVMECQLTTAMRWMKANKLTVNLSKTKCMTFGTRQTLSTLGNLELWVEDTVIEHVEKYKYLGMILDPMLSFKEHVSHVRSKV